MEQLTWASAISQKSRSFIRKRWKLVRTAFKVLVFWSICEIFLCFMVLCLKERENYPENFLHNFCDSKLTVRFCDNYLQVALYGRLILSFISLLGILTGVSSLAAPWFLMNALGLFPLLPIIYSCFDEYKTLDKAFRNILTKISPYLSWWIVVSNDPND